MTIGIFADSKVQGPPFSPEQLTGLRVWFDASDVASITQVANAVSQWNDKSGNAFHVSQATGTRQPLTNTNNINGKNCIYFDGTTDFLTGVSGQLVNVTTGEWTAFGVVKVNDTVAAARIIFTQDNGAGSTRVATFLRTASANLQSIAYNTVPTGFTDGYSGMVVGTNYFFSAVRTSTTIEVFRNGATNGLTATTGTPATGFHTLSVGAAFVAASPSAFWMGEIGELIVYNTALSASDRIKVENYLKTKWGL